MKYEALDDLKQIKKDYGEEMSHFCRKLFPTLLETPGLLYHILSTHFAKSRNLYDDIVSEHKKYIFKEYIYSFIGIDSSKVQETSKSVKELLDEAGYDIYECKSFFETQKFRDFYSKQGLTLGSEGYTHVGNVKEITVPNWARREPYNKYIIVDSNGDIKVPMTVGNEELCTFNDLYRADNCYIFFIVKKDVDKIRREDFEDPQREDEYSTSVLGLQFDKGKRQGVSIKSRYNHIVIRPDATYSNNLENIVPGLTEAFEKDYGFNINGEYKSSFKLADYVEAKNGKFYKYNYRINGIYYCLDNIIIDNRNIVDMYSDKSKYLFIDYFILDLKEKKIKFYDERVFDSFVDGLQNIIKVEANNKKGYKEIKLVLEDNKEVVIKLDERGRIIGYDNKYVEGIGDKFLYFNTSLEEFNSLNLRKCGDGFLYENKKIQTLHLPNLIECGDYFLCENNILSNLNLLKLERCGDRFLYSNRMLSNLTLPKLMKCGSDFLYENKIVNNLNLCSLVECGDNFMEFNNTLKKLDLPKLVICGSNFLQLNKILSDVSLSKLEECGTSFLGFNKFLQELKLPKLMRCGKRFLESNNFLQKLDLPNLKECEEGFLRHNDVLQTLNLKNISKLSYYNLQDRHKKLLVDLFDK